MFAYVCYDIVTVWLTRVYWSLLIIDDTSLSFVLIKIQIHFINGHQRFTVCVAAYATINQINCVCVCVCV